MRFFDSHCHLDDPRLDAVREKEVVAAFRLGVQDILIPGVTERNWQKTLSVAGSYPGCRVALGLHPYFIRQHKPEHLEILQSLLKAEPVSAIGEIGLDFFLKDLDAKSQAFFFQAQLEIARDAALPVVIHSRKANDPVALHLRQAGVSTGVIHAFSGSWQQARRFLDMGFRLGVGGAVTWSRARRIRDVVSRLPCDGYVLETDAPDIPPAFLATGELNRPSLLPAIAAVVAVIRNEPLEKVAADSYANASSLFGNAL